VTVPVEAASRRSGAAIGEVSKVIGATLTASAGRLSADTERLSDKAAAIAAALDEVATKLNAMQTPERLVEIRLEPVVHLLTQAVEQMTAQSEGQAKAVNDALSITDSATQRTTDLVAVLREEFDAKTATNSAALEVAVSMIKTTADVLNEIKTSSRDYVEALATMLERTDETMRVFTEVLVQSGAESVARIDRLAETLPAIEGQVQALAAAAERISSVVEALRALPPQPETVD
jgi:hypothetical protein